MDSKQPNDIEEPDECPECGFEPTASETIRTEYESDDGQGVRDALADAEYWIHEVTTHDNGGFSVEIVCPECGAALYELEPSEEVLSSIGIDVE